MILKRDDKIPIISVHMKIKYIIVVCLLLTTVFSKANTLNDRGTKSMNFPIVKVLDTAYSYKTVPAVNNTWGYDIFKGGKRIIHQQNMPGISGNEGFKSASDAEKVSKFVITKLKNGEMPPSVSKEELINLKVLK
jgi:hypothetical protein